MFMADRKILTFALILMFALICANTLAQVKGQKRWRLATTGTNVDVYYDRKGITRTQKGTVRVWIKYEYTKERAYIKHSVSLEEYQCTEGMSRTLSNTTYKESGEVINSITPRTPRWDYVTPDSIGESLFKIVCEGGNDLQLKLDKLEESENAKRETDILAHNIFTCCK